MELPLLERMLQLGVDSFAPDASPDTGANSYCGAGAGERALPVPGEGEQYRFHFDMTKCIGCKCCVVACNEQNGNPADILWRRVGEIEGGTYPSTQRHYLSIGCNHCLEPTCMTGCPVNAYTKDGLTGIVRHSADACIGCQYCTWNCSYGVPQYNAERGVVGKCDMCYGRLTRGESPACVSACPEGAIEIEVVRIAEWRGEYKQMANSPGMPSADDSISTTRITLPTRASHDLKRVDLTFLRLEHAHWPLIVMTVLTQFAVGTFAAVSHLGAHRWTAVGALLMSFVALGASTLHLGRPIHAARALRMWRRSWLSREVLLFTLFAGAGTAFSASLVLGCAMSPVLGAITVACGIAGVGASARLYLVPGRPAWNSPVTLLEFFSTVVLLGFASAAVLGGTTAHTVGGLLLSAVSAALVIGAKLLRVARSSRHELYGSWQLLSTLLASKLLLRVLLLVAGTAFMLGSVSPFGRLAGLLLIVGGEFIGRYLFFVSVVPSNIASSYIMQEAA